MKPFKLNASWYRSIDDPIGKDPILNLITNLFGASLALLTITQSLHQIPKSYVPYNFYLIQLFNAAWTKIELFIKETHNQSHWLSA
jgi:hypothetical protein